LRRFGLAILILGVPAAEGQFRSGDFAPVSIGVVIDDGGGMREKQALVSDAVLTLLDGSYPEDELFIVHFKAKAYLDQEFTSDKDTLFEALRRTDYAGPSAMRDAVGDALDYAKNHGKQKRRVLLVITDGDDTVSHETTESLVRKARESAIAIYCIGLLKGEDGRTRQSARRDFKALADGSGGIGYFPKNKAEVDRIIREFLRELRSQYARDLAQP
jgi:VWFA-related protein